MVLLEMLKKTDDKINFKKCLGSLKEEEQDGH